MSKRPYSSQYESPNIVLVGKRAKTPDVEPDSMPIQTIILPRNENVKPPPLHTIPLPRGQPITANVLEIPYQQPTNLQIATFSSIPNTNVPISEIVIPPPLHTTIPLPRAQPITEVPYQQPFNLQLATLSSIPNTNVPISDYNYCFPPVESVNPVSPYPQSVPKNVSIQNSHLSAINVPTINHELVSVAKEVPSTSTVEVKSTLVNSNAVITPKDRENLNTNKLSWATTYLRRIGQNNPIRINLLSRKINKVKTEYFQDDRIINKSVQDINQNSSQKDDSVKKTQDSLINYKTDNPNTESKNVEMQIKYETNDIKQADKQIFISGKPNVIEQENYTNHLKDPLLQESRNAEGGNENGPTNIERDEKKNKDNIEFYNKVAIKLPESYETNEHKGKIGTKYPIEEKQYFEKHFSGRMDDINKSLTSTQKQSMSVKRLDNRDKYNRNDRYFRHEHEKNRDRYNYTHRLERANYRSSQPYMAEDNKNNYTKSNYNKSEGTKVYFKNQPRQKIIDQELSRNDESFPNNINNEQDKTKIKSKIQRVGASKPYCRYEKDYTEIKDLRTLLSRKNLRYNLDNIKEKSKDKLSQERSNLVISVPNDNKDEFISKKIKLEKNDTLKRKKYKKMKVIINVICKSTDNSDESEDDGDDDKGKENDDGKISNGENKTIFNNEENNISNEDLSFLDDLNIDEIVESLVHQNVSNNNELNLSNNIITIDLCDLSSEDDASDASTVHLEELSEMKDDLKADIEMMEDEHSKNIRLFYAELKLHESPTTSTITSQESMIPTSKIKIESDEQIHENLNTELLDPRNENCDKDPESTAAKTNELTLTTIKKEPLDNNQINDKYPKINEETIAMPSVTIKDEPFETVEINDEDPKITGNTTPIPSATMPAIKDEPLDNDEMCDKPSKVTENTTAIQSATIKAEPLDYDEMYNKGPQTTTNPTAITSVTLETEIIETHSADVAMEINAPGNGIITDSIKDSDLPPLEEKTGDSLMATDDKSEPNENMSGLESPKFTAQLKSDEVDRPIERPRDFINIIEYALGDINSARQNIFSNLVPKEIVHNNIITNTLALGALNVENNTIITVDETNINTIISDENDALTAYTQTQSEGNSDITPNEEQEIKTEANTTKQIISIDSTQTKSKSEAIKSQDKLEAKCNIAINMDADVIINQNKSLSDHRDKLNNDSDTCKILNNTDILSKIETKQSKKIQLPRHSPDEVKTSKTKITSPKLTTSPDQDKLPNRESKHISQLQEVMSSQVKKRFDIISVIKFGSFSRIFQCKDSNKHVFALKVIDTQGFRRKIIGINKEKMLLEIQRGILREDCNTVRFIKSYSLGSHRCFLMEYCSKTLATALRENAGPFHIERIQKLSQQLIDAVIVLQRKNIIHSNINPRHILMSNENTLKLCGFDEAYYYEDRPLDNNIGVVNYRAPEIILGFSTGFSIDVWSTALVMYEMATKRKLFPGIYSNDILFKQICTLGPLHEDMVEMSVFWSHHLDGDMFKKYYNARCFNTIPLHTIQKNNILFTTINYNLHMLSETIPKKYKNKYINKLFQLYELLQQMLTMHPFNRLPIEMVRIHRFLREDL